MQNNSIVEEKYYLIQPPDMKFDTKNIGINKLTPIDVKNAPLFPEVWDKIKHYFNGNTIIVAHNAVFDMSVLKDCLIKYKIEIPNFDYVCSIPISTRACGGEKVGASLEDRAKHFGIDIGQHHNSLDDAKACANLVIECLKIKKRNSLISYCNTYSSISIKHFKDLNPLKEFKKSYKRFNKIIISEIIPTVNNINNSNDFYGKRIVFTGELKSMSRKEAMQKVVNLGGVLKSNISSITDYLIVGVQDKSLVGEDGMSIKEKNAYELIKKGNPIKILSESDFLNLIENKKTVAPINDKKTSDIHELDSMITFSSISNKIDKLKEWGLLSPKAQDLKNIYYKNKNGTYKCQIIGYLSKNTKYGCLNNVYETIILKINDSVVKIAPDYLLEMQKKDFSFSYGQTGSTD